jgi:hypothetical protein
MARVRWLTLNDRYFEMFAEFAECAFKRIYRYA